MLKNKKINLKNKEVPSQRSFKPVSLKKTNEARHNWGLATAKAVNPYFSQPYQDSDLNNAYLCLKLSDREVVYRPNHSLAHGLRQAYLAVNLALIFKHAKEELLGPKAQKLCLWVKKRFKDDPKFLEKVLFTNAFQRTGRQSELSTKENRYVYEKYLTADQKNFETKIRELDLVGDGKLFKDQKEIDVYKEALVRKFDEESDEKDMCLLQEDVVFLSRLFYTGHLLDLRRIPHFSKEKILKDVSKQLFGTETPNTVEQQMLLKSWRRSRDYLKATGDRDMEDSSRRDWDKAVFYAQAQNPELLIEALELAMTKPEEKLLSSLLAHTQTMRELKTTIKKYDGEEKVSEPQTEHQKKIEDFRKNLKNAPYTASEAYLKIILTERYGNSTYIEIPSDCPEEKVRQIIYQNLCSFLPEQKKADKEYVTILVDAMMEERKKRDKVVLYHTTEEELGIFCKICSELRNQLAMQGSVKSMTILRALDEAFITLNKSVNTQKGKADVSDFIKEFKLIDDTNQKYRDMCISTNFGLFGSDGETNSNTSSMFYNVISDKVTLNPPLYDKLIAYIEEKTGIFGIYPLYKKMLDNFTTSHDTQPKRNRKLIQIFIDPKVLEEVTYFSVAFGHPITKEEKIQSLQNPLELLRNHPEKLKDYLLTLSARRREQHVRLCDLQARLFMRPDVMLNVKDSELIEIKSYWRLPVENEKTCHSQIQAGVNEILLPWLKNGCPVESDIFLQETIKLPGFIKMVYHGSTTSQPPQVQFTTVEQRFVKLLMNKQDTHAAALLEKAYEELKNKSFTIPISSAEYGYGKSTFDLATVIMNCNPNPSIEILEVALKKNIFKGGTQVFEVLSKLESGFLTTVKNVLEAFNNCSSPSDTARLFMQYCYEDQMKASSWIIDIIAGINYLENNEKYLKAFLPFFKSQGRFVIEIFCENFSKTPAYYKDLDLFEEALKIFPADRSRQRDFCQNMNEVLIKVHSYKENFSSQVREYIFSKASKLTHPYCPEEIGSAYLGDKFKFMDILSKIIWEPNTLYPFSPSFTAWDVLKYAQANPDSLNMEFLESPTGLELINSVIEKLNVNEIPKGEKIFTNAKSIYDNSSETDLNKHIIASYVSSLDDIVI